MTEEEAKEFLKKDLNLQLYQVQKSSLENFHSKPTSGNVNATGTIDGRY